MKCYKGGCHCGHVKFEIEASNRLVAHECNCSICKMSGFLHLIVNKENFHLTTDISQLTTYRFNTDTAQHVFCPNCGVKSFYVPRSHPDGFSINLRCLSNVDADDVTIHPFDGANRETAVNTLHKDVAAQQARVK